MRAARVLARRAGREVEYEALRAVVNPAARRTAQDEVALRAVLAAVLRPDSVAVDVGANVGTVLAAIVAVAPAGRHVAFEPIPALAAGLRSRWPAVDVRAAACSDVAGRAEFTVAATDTLSRLGAHPGERIEVDVVRLDDALDGVAPALIKIDVEGAEVAVVRGAQRVLREHRPVVVFEHSLGGADSYGTTSEELWDLLDGCGLRVFDLQGAGPFDRAAFAAQFGRPVWNWLAAPR
ncbi:MAG: hypothetical protein QOF76_4510 [Solirubrobacteraceae bacterium]|nr:hypothetical protein [Solirubrobacteraceae bacterium]